MGKIILIISCFWFILPFFFLVILLSRYPWLDPEFGPISCWFQPSSLKNRSLVFLLSFFLFSFHARTINFLLPSPRFLLQFHHSIQDLSSDSIYYDVFLSLFTSLSQLISSHPRSRGGRFIFYSRKSEYQIHRDWLFPFMTSSDPGLVSICCPFLLGFF